MRAVLVDGRNLTIEEVVAVAEQGAPAHLDEQAVERMRESRRVLDQLTGDGQIVYGVNTGVGSFQDVIIPPERIEELQRNLVRSTACGVGDPLPGEVVRAMMLLRANALACGYSGVREEIPLLLLGMLEKGVHPVVPSKGSLGSSGDLAPLAHIALVLMGEGEAQVKGRRYSGGEALRRSGLRPLRLQAKEGLALINGTQLMTGAGCLCLYRSLQLLKTSQIALAMSLESLKGTDRAFDERIQQVRPHGGQRMVAGNLRALLEGSEIIASHRNCSMVQDAYTLRCAPQVLGAVRDVMDRVRCVLEVEINSATDNPLILDGEVLSGGNFHGQPVAFALDHLGLAVHTMGNYAERRIARLTDGKLSGLPEFLVKARGLESGLMIAQYVAASLVGENKILASPASADSIPASANQEDFNSMGAAAANKLLTIVENCQHIIAIELLCASQALEFHHAAPGKGTGLALKFVRGKVPRVVEDRPLSGDILTLKDCIEDGSLLSAVESEVPLA